MTKERLSGTVVRRVELRKELKPVKAWWHSGSPDPDWLVITHWTGPKAFESFELACLKRVIASCAHSTCDSQKTRLVRLSGMSYDTLRIAKAQAHADIGIEYVEWEFCGIPINDNPDRIIDWGRAVPAPAPVAST